MDIKKTAIVLALSACAGSIVSMEANAQNADNTKMNAPAFSGGEPTAQDQSNRKSAVKETARLRRAILRQKGLSINAQNVKIIDENGCVVLRGPVNSLNEKNIIDKLANQYCENNYRNELEVKANK